MSEFTKYLTGRVSAGGMNRREFIGRAMAAGVTLAAADAMFATSAMAQTPKKGGHLKLGLEGGSSTDSIDPASATSQVMFVAVRTWGDTLVETHPQTRKPLPSKATPPASRATRTGAPLCCLAASQPCISARVFSSSDQAAMVLRMASLRIAAIAGRSCAPPSSMEKPAVIPVL